MHYFKTALLLITLVICILFASVIENQQQSIAVTDQIDLSVSN